jgi:hypothetical protein
MASSPLNRNYSNETIMSKAHKPGWIKGRAHDSFIAIKKKLFK